MNHSSPANQTKLAIPNPNDDTQNANLAGENTSSPQPNNEATGGVVKDHSQTDWAKELIDSEKQRRSLFAHAVYVGLGIIISLYFVLTIWVFCNLDNHGHNVWHIATILALPPTTILFLLIKVLAKSLNDTKEDKQASTPTGEALEKSGELVDKFLDIFKTLLNKK